MSKPEMPQLGRMIDIPVYLVHNSDDPEDYFFIFDFELFVEQSRQGLFVRPKLQVWPGRDDFNRPQFAGQFRESFTQEFDLARAALENSNESSGWFSWGVLQEIVTTNVASFYSECCASYKFIGRQNGMECSVVTDHFRGSIKRIPA